MPGDAFQNGETAFTLEVSNILYAYIGTAIILIELLRIIRALLGPCS